MKKFSPEEALFAQTFATEKEGKYYSEQADEKNYEEAKVLLQKLKENNINWLDIDWDKVDFNNADSYNKLETQLEVAAKYVLGKKVSANQKKDIDSKLGHIAVPLAVSVAILLGAGNVDAKDFNRPKANTQEIKKSEDIEIVGFASESEKRGVQNIIKEYGLSKLIKKVELVSRESRDEHDSGAFAEAVLKITGKDGKIREVRGMGSVRGDEIMSDLLEVVENVINLGLEKIDKKIELHQATDFSLLRAEYRAICSAFETFEHYKDWPEESKINHNGYDRPEEEYKK